MPDKGKEINCLRCVLSSAPRGSFAKDIHALLGRHKDSVLSESEERPDIILLGVDRVIGIEHFQADLFFHISPKGKVQSISESQKHKSEKLVSKYADKALLDQDINTGEAIGPLAQMTEERSNAPNNFDYESFLANFSKVCLEHNKKCDSYRECLGQRGPGRASTLGCIIEIPYLKGVGYVVTGGNETGTQEIQGVPMTRGMLSVIGQMGGFDFVILYIRSMENPGKTEDTICRYFDPRDIDRGVNQQGIKIFDSFLTKGLGSVSIPQKRITIDGSGNATIRVLVTIPLNGKCQK